jgi:hypothetical protein
MMMMNKLKVYVMTAAKIADKNVHLAIFAAVFGFLL